MTLRLTGPGWGFVTALVLAVVCAAVLPASAQPKRKRPKAEPASSTKPEPKADAPKDAAPKDTADADPKAPKKDGKPGVKNFDFTGLDLAGRMRTPQLLYFLERANEELERASLEKRSFIPQLVRTVEDETL